MTYSLDIDYVDGREAKHFEFVAYGSFQEIWLPCSKELQLNRISEFSYLELQRDELSQIIDELRRLKFALIDRRKIGEASAKDMDKLIEQLTRLESEEFSSATISG